MFRIALLVLAFQSIPEPVQQDEIKAALAHAEALYYNARFADSIALLNRVEETLKTDSGRLEDKIATKLRLALAEIGLNENAKAKSFFVELYKLDPNYALDQNQFSPKVMSVAAEAKAEQTKNQCFTAQTDARSYLEAGKSAELIALFRSSRTACPPLVAMQSEAAETLYKNGLIDYRKDDFAKALPSFEAAVALAPDHELALQYIDIIRSKQELSQDRLNLQWQRNFDAGKYTAAATDYRQVRNQQAIEHMNSSYRKVLTDLVQTWNSTCSNVDTAAKNAMRAKIAEVLPVPSFGTDIRTQMASCEEPAPVALARVADTPQTSSPRPVGCLETPSSLAMARLKTRVDPALTNELRFYLRNNGQMLMRVKVRISESGDVDVTSVNGGNTIFNNAVTNALEQWKFATTRDSSGPRCVETEIPLVLKLAQ